ncbi:unnamed protein product [Fraxinus pennsylvanica]|uniref:RING-type E3 ubiquitin transferase n=1 Tax=Fraxinus pennsylvanica TaxID=56036 RepID=A0AAD1ZLG2_9LAMI|nr:unnamed protein product [Fraxinus pennsylvanica]
MAPSIFPLDISVSDPFTEIPADMLLFQICVPFAIEHFQLRTTIKSLLRYWFIAVGWALGLTDILLPKPEDNRGLGDRYGVPGRQDREHACFAEEYGNDEPADPEWNFELRIVLLLLVAWMILHVFNSMLIVRPVTTGQAVFYSLPTTHSIKCNGDEVLEFCLVRFGNGMALLSRVLCCCQYGQEWIFVIHVLIGLAFELLVIVPMQVPVDESPVFHLHQDWALGLIFLKFWTRLVMLDHAGGLELQDAVFGYPLVMNSTMYRFALDSVCCASVLNGFMYVSPTSTIQYVMTDN